MFRFRAMLAPRVARRGSVECRFRCKSRPQTVVSSCESFRQRRSELTRSPRWRGQTEWAEGETECLGAGQMQGCGLTLALTVLCGSPQHTRPKRLKSRD